jgi:hypothetical protein
MTPKSPPRRRPRRRTLPVAALACLSLGLLPPLSAAAQESEASGIPADWSIERIEAGVEAKGLERLVIENPWGDVRVRTFAESRLEWIAAAQRQREDPRLERVELEGEGAERTLRAAFADLEAAPGPGWERRRIDLAVTVPAGVALRIVTARGLAEARGAFGALEVESGAGAVRLRVSGGPLRVRTDSGEISAVLGPERWSQPASFESTTGNVVVTFAPATDADVVLEGTGMLATDYSLSVEKTGPRTRRGRAKLGAGGPEVRLASRTGDLRIIELPAPSGPAGAGE